jgi:hypothetical protein
VSTPRVLTPLLTLFLCYIFLKFDFLSNHIQKCTLPGYGNISVGSITIRFRHTPLLYQSLISYFLAILHDKDLTKYFMVSPCINQMKQNI